MHILMLVQSPIVHGPVAKHTPLLITSLQDLGCDIQTSLWGRHSDKETLSDKLFGRMDDLFQVREKLKSRKFDMVIVKTAHDWATLSRDLPLLLVTRHLCSHIVLQMHGSQSDRMVARGNEPLKIATRWLLERCDAVLVLSTEEQRQWQQFYPQGNFYVVDNPFLPPDEDSSIVQDISWDIPSDCPVLLFVGRLLVEKGLYDILASLPTVLQHTKCHLLIAGDGSERMRLQKKIHDLSLDQHVTLVGYLKGEQLSSAYKRADIFILPSYAEGFPTVITEAMFAGLPVVTTQLRGMADHLLEGVNALFVPIKDPLSLASAVEALLANPDLRKRMSEANLEKVKEFAPEKVARRYLDILKAVASD